MSSGRFSRHRHQSRDYLQLHGDAENLLREVVVNLARDAVALLQHGAETRAHLSQTQRVELPREQTEAERTQRIEPDGAVEMRPQPERHGGGRAAPDAVVVARDDLEPVIAGAQVRVIGHAPVAAVNPIFVEAEETVLVSDLLRRDETEARVVEVEAGLSRCEFDARRGGDRLAVNTELLDDRRRRLLV